MLPSSPCIHMSGYASKLLSAAPPTGNPPPQSARAWTVGSRVSPRIVTLVPTSMPAQQAARACTHGGMAHAGRA